MNTIKMELSKLHKTDKNIRTHSATQIQEYVRSLKMFGQTRPFVVTEDYEILIGNGMYDAMLSAGWTEGDVYIMEGLSLSEKRKLMLADNKIYEMGGNNVGLLEDILKDLNGDFDVPGYDPELLDLIVADISDIDNEITNYGKVEDVKRPSEVIYETKTAEEVGSADAYLPSKKLESGEIVQNTDYEQNEGNYVICPKCGEKIWLQ